MSDETADVRAAKAAMRSRIRSRRAAVDPETRAAASATVAHLAFELPEMAGVHAVLGYHALAEELDPAPLLHRLRARGVEVALPRVTGPGELSLHWVDAEEELRAGGLGIMEPDPDSPGPLPSQVDLVIVPGVAFDARGGRLGFGGGYYDRLLAALPAGCPRVALAYEVQLVDEVPAAAHDERVGVVVTPTGVVRAS